MALTQRVEFNAPRTSQALNAKLAGIIPAGVYYGFNIKPAGGMNILLEKDEDYPVANVAVIDRDNYSITVAAKDNETVAVPTTGERYVCIQAAYFPDRVGSQEIVFRSTPEDHHVVLGKLDVPADATEITADMISEDGRTVGNPLLWLIEISSKFLSQTTDILAMNTRLTNLENWAKGQNYDPSTTYSGS